MSSHAHDDGPVADLDLLRAWIEGRLPPAERQRLEAALARDPALAAQASRMLVVWRATAPGLPAPAPSAVTFEDVLRRAQAGPRRARPVARRAAAAALVLLTAAGAFALWRLVQGGAPARVQLEAIPLDPVGGAAAAPRVPDLLADWSPVQDGRIRWLDSLDDAQAVSAATRRPVFVYGYVEGCPICAGFQAREFRDADVLAWVDRTVPVHVDLLALEPAERDALWARRYPLLELQDERGRILRTFAGTFGEVDMPTEFAGAVEEVSVPDWAGMRAAAAALRDARRAEAQGAWAAAAQGYASVAAREDLPAWRADAEDGLARVAAAARALLLGSLAEAGDEAALTRFERGANAFAGTPFERDLQAVLAAWRASGRFPALDAAP